MAKLEFSKTHKIAFLDRDGVINKSNINKGYIGYVKNFKWMPGAIKTIKYLNDLKYKVVVVSNQSGIARGYFKMRDVYILHGYIQKELEKNQTRIDKFLFCPYHKDGVIKKYRKNSNLRKPKNGMFKRIDKIWKVDKKKSFMIGDQKTDMGFAKKSNIKGFMYRSNNLYKFVKKINFIK
jgi:D-glycero-D-manno-heptose 1,7-bisphosphate phosphatase